MKTCKILIDSRRKINSGVGRVSQWISNNINKINCNELEIFFLVNPESITKDYIIPSENIIETSISPFSSGEFKKLPDFLSKSNFSLYVNPQMSWSYLHATPTINIIHDLWAIKNPEWLPSKSDLKARFGIRDLSYFVKMANFLEENNPDKYLTPYGILKWKEAKKSGNDIWVGCWAQYAAVTALSQKFVLVSTFVESELKKYFKNTENAVLINNIPKNFNCVRKRSGSHFLTLSKIEKRKNLDYLLDSYIEYIKSNTDRKFPLVIAGDPGYKNVAATFLNRLSALQAQGYKIIFKPSVSDNELKKLLENAVALVFPSHFEGFGLPPLEAMLAEVPVIATPTGMMNTEIGKFAILIDGKDKYALAKHMEIVARGQFPREKVVSAKESVRRFADEAEAAKRWGLLVKECIYSSFTNAYRYQKLTYCFAG